MKKAFVLMAALAMTSVLSATAENTTDTPTKKTRSEVFITEKGTEWEPAGEGVTRQIMGYDGQVMLVKVKFEKGAVGTAHTHYHTQTTYVASGKFEFTVGGNAGGICRRRYLHRTGCTSRLQVPGGRFAHRLLLSDAGRFPEKITGWNVLVFYFKHTCVSAEMCLRFIADVSTF